MQKAYHAGKFFLFYQLWFKTSTKISHEALLMQNRDPCFC